MRAFVLVLLALAPLAAAQPSPGAASVNVFLLDPGHGFVPGTTGKVEVRVTYTYPAGSAPQPQPTPDYAENTSATSITLSAKSFPSWVESVAFEPPVLAAKIPLERQAVGGSVALFANVTLVIKPDAPALTREDLVVIAEAAPNGNLQGARAESPALKIRVEPVGKLNVTSDPTVVIPGGRWSTVTYHVKNEGNGDVVARLNVTVKPENSEVEFPRTLTLSRNATMPVEVRVRTPWTNAELGTLTLEAVPLVDGEDGRAATFDVDVRGESAVPGPGLAVVAAAIALALVARRK